MAEKEKIELKIKNVDRIHEELVQILAPHREKPERSVLFIAEGTDKNPIIGIRYPGKKVRKREGERLQIHWANLYDFEVVPYKDGKELKTKQFTFEELVKDFDEHKKESDAFWRMLEELYKHNTITKKLPKLRGINPEIYLRVVKWIWIQEDLNYRFSWEEVNSPIRYMLTNRTGTPTRKGAGRGKFFAVLVLLRNKFFTFEEVKKIIPLY